MNSTILRNLPFRLNFLILKFFTILFLSFLSNFNGNISAYTTRVDTLTLDFNGQSKASFGTNDPYFTVKTRAYFCLETAYSAGQYRFVVRITDSKGGLVKEYITAKSNLPTAQSQVVEDTISNIPFSLLPGPGYYRISSTFEEFYPERTTSLPSYGMAFLDFKDSGYEGSLFTTGVKLLSPAKGSQVLNPQPFFQWMPSLVAKKYTIYVSDNPDPEVIPLWMEKNVTGTLIQYPAGVRQLEKGKKYYWMVRGLDALDRPVGPNFGRSEVFDFYISEGGGDRIILKYPIDATKITSIPFEFEWEGFLGKFTYELTLSADSEGTEKIWTTDSSEYKTFYPLSAPDLIPGKKYYWKVRSIIKGFEQTSKSETGEFIYSPVTKPTADNTIPAGSAGITGQIFDSAGRPLADAIFSAEGPSDNLDAFKVLSVLSDSTGKYSLPLVPGSYKFKIFKNRFEMQELALKVEPAKVVSKNFSLFGNTTELYGSVVNAYNGDIIPGAAVVLKNAFFEDKVLTSDAGVFSFKNIRPGKYTAEISFSPFFKSALQDIEIITGENKINLQLEPVLIGSLKGRLFEKETGNGMHFADIKVENISLVQYSDIVTAPTGATPPVIFDGSYEVAQLKAGKYKISVSTTGYPASEKIIDIIGGSETKADFEYSRKRVAVSGKIVRTDGSGVYRAEIFLKNLPDVSTCYTAADGSFSCQFPQGTMTLGFYYPGLSASDKQITAESDQNIGIITLDKPVGVLNVKIKDSVGNLLPGIEAQVLDYAPLAGQVFKSDTSGAFPQLKLPLWQSLKISFSDPEGNFLNKLTQIRLESETENLTESLSRLLAIKGSTLSASLQPLGETTINIPGSSFAAISSGDGKFMLSLAELNPMPETITLVFKRPGYYTETRSIMSNMLFAPVDVRMRDEQEKVTSFTSVRINNSIREIRSELEDVQSWVQRTITKVNNDLAETQRIADAYQAEIDSKLAIIASKKAELEIEAQKPYLTAKALKLSVELKGLSEDVQIATNAMSSRVTGMLDTIQRFVDLFKRAVELKLPTLEMRITNLLDSVTESPFLDEETRAHLKSLALNIKTQYEVEVKTYCQNGLAEIDRIMKEIADKMRQNLAGVIAKNKENAASIQAFVDGITERIAVAQAAAQSSTATEYDPENPDTVPDPLSSGPVEKIDPDDVVINVTNNADLTLALKIADIINERNKLQNKIKAAIAKLNDIPLGLKKFNEKADIVNYNLTNAKSKLDKLKTEVDRYGKLYAQAQSYAWNIEQIINLTSVGGFQLDPYIEKVQGDDTKVRISGNLSVAANNLGSWDIPLVPFEYDLASAIDKEIVKLRSADLTSHTYFDAGGKADPRKLLIKQDIAEYNTRKTRTTKSSGSSATATVGVQKGTLNEAALSDFKDVSNVDNLFPQELLNFKESFLPKNLANLSSYADNLPAELKNFSPETMFPEKINNFDIQTLSDADKAEILDSDAYDYVWRQMNLFIKKQVPSVKADFENLDDEFLMRKYVPGEVVELYEVSKQNDENLLLQKLYSLIPPELHSFKSGKSAGISGHELLLTQFQSSIDFSKFLKLYLPENLSQALPEDLTQIQCTDVGPDYICNFDPQKVKEDAQKSLEEKIFSPELPIDGVYSLGAATDTRDAVADASKGLHKKKGYEAPKSSLPFDIGLRQVRLGFEKSSRRAYLVSELFINAENLKIPLNMGTISKKQEIVFGDFKIFGDGKTSADEFKFEGNIGAEVSGFSVNITDFAYNHKFQTVTVGGSASLKILSTGKPSTFTIRKCVFGFDTSLSKWTLDEFAFQFGDGIPIGPILLKTMDYQKVEEKISFGGSFKPKVISNQFFGSEFNLTRIGFAKDIDTGVRIFEMAEGENLNLEFIKPYAAFKIQNLSIRKSKDEFEIQMQNSAMNILWPGVIHSPDNSKDPYSVNAGTIEIVYDYNSGPKKIRVEGLTLTFKPWVVGAFTFGPTSMDLSVNHSAGSKTIWDLGLCLQLGVAIAGAETDEGAPGGVGSKTCFRFITDEGARLEHAKLDIALGPMAFVGVLTIQKTYFYAQVSAKLFQAQIKGEFYQETGEQQNGNNWFVSAEVKGFSLPIVTIGVLGVSISGAGIKIGERNSKLVLGITGMLAIDSGAAAASPGFQWFEGTTRLSYIAGAEIITFDGKGLLIPQILPSLGDVYIQAQLLMKDEESSLDLLAMLRLDLARVVTVNAQFDVHLGLDYLVAVVNGAAKVKMEKFGVEFLVNASGGFAFGLRLREEVKVPASVSYDGTQFLVPKNLVGGYIIYFNANARIDIEKIIAVDILSGYVSLGAGSVIVVDYGRPLVGGGVYGYFNGQVSLMAIVQVSIYLGFDLGAQIGKTKTYFSGLGEISVKAKIAFLTLGPFAVSIMVRFGEVPDGLPDKPAGFDPNFKPKGTVEFIVQDMFGVPMPGAKVGLETLSCVADSRGKCMISSVPLNSTYIPSAKDPKGLYALREIITPNGSYGDMTKDFEFQFSGQKIVIVMAPTELLNHLLVSIELQGYEIRSCITGLPQFQAELVSAKSGERVTAMAKCVGANAMSAGSRAAYNHPPGIYAAFMRREAVDEYYVVLRPTGDNEFKETKGLKFKLNDLPNADTFGEIDLPAKKIAVIPEFERFTVKGKIKSESGISFKPEEVTLLNKNNEKIQGPIEASMVGYFEFPNVVSGYYTLQVKKEGYKAKYKRLFVGKGKCPDAPSGMIGQKSATIEKDAEVDDSRYCYPTNGDPVEISFNKQSSALTVKVIDGSGKPKDGVGLRFMKGAKVINESICSASAGCVFPDVEIDEDYIITRKTGDTTIFSGISESDIATFKNDQISVTMKQPKDATITLIVQTGPKIIGRIVDKAGAAVEFDPDRDFTLEDSTGKEMKFFGKSDSDGKFEIILGTLGSSGTAELNIDVDGFEAIAFDVNLQKGPVNLKSGKSAIDLGEIQLDSSEDLGELLKKKPIKTPGGFTLAVEDFKPAGIAPTKLSGAQVFKVNGNLLFEKTGAGTLSGDIGVKDILVEVKADGKGGFDYKIVTEKMEKSQITSTSEANLNFMGGTGSAKDLQIDLSSSVITSGVSLTMKNIPRLDCGSEGIKVESTDDIMKIDSSGKVSYNVKVGSVASIKVIGTPECKVKSNIGGKGISFHLKNDLSLTNTGGTISDNYALGIEGVPKIGQAELASSWTLMSDVSPTGQKPGSKDGIKVSTSQKAKHEDGSESLVKVEQITDNGIVTKVCIPTTANLTALQLKDPANLGACAKEGVIVDEKGQLAISENAVFEPCESPYKNIYPNGVKTPNDVVKVKCESLQYIQYSNDNKRYWHFKESDVIP